MAKDYASNVFINCPFDEAHRPIRNAIVFAIFDCGFIPRSALEEDNSGNVRFDKIKRLIAMSKFGVHDISRTELDQGSDLPRFNMPLELGVFIGAERFGDAQQKKKNLLILDHDEDPSKAITHIRNWLNTASGRKTIPGGKAIHSRYIQFMGDLPDICKELQLDSDEITHNDYCNFASDWIKAQS